MMPSEVQTSTTYTALPTQAPASTGRVDQALSDIRDNLDQGFFSDVTHGDLTDINGTLAGLTSDERNHVIAGLSDSELNTWTGEIDNGGGVFGLTEGLSSDERRDLHASMAQSLDGQQLARVYNAYDNRDQRLELVGALATHGTADARVDFVDRLSEGTTDDAGAINSEGFITYSTNLGDTEARGVADLLGSLGGNDAALTDAYSRLTDDQLNAVFEAAAQHEMHTGFGSTLPTYSYDAAPMTRMIDAATTSGNADLKARVFEFAGRHLDTISGANGLLTPTVGAHDAASAIRGSMETLLDTDANGVVEGLEKDYQAGKGMSAFLQQTLGEDGGADTVRDYVAQLILDNDLSGNALDRFTSGVNQDGGVFYPSAERLGYFAGSLHQAFEGMGADRQETADTLNTIFGGLTGQIPGPGVSDVAGFLTEEAVSTAVSQYEDGDAELFESLVDLTTPTAADGRPYDGPAEVSYNEGWESVTRIPLN